MQAQLLRSLSPRATRWLQAAIVAAICAATLSAALASTLGAAA